MQKYNNLIDGTTTTVDGLSVTTKQNTSSGHRRLKEKVTYITINSAHRQRLDEELVEPDSSGLYLREVIDDYGTIRIEQYTAEILNNEYVPDPGEPDRPYFQKPDGNIYKLKPLYPHPHRYEYPLPRIFTNVKSVRLIGSEIPNTISNINRHNNLITIEVIDTDVELSDEEILAGVTNRIPLKPSVTEPFYVVKLQYGNYDIYELIEHINQSINDVITQQTIETFDDLITVEYVKTSGEVKFMLHNDSGRDLRFHLRFHSTSDTPDIRTLWYMLGFTAPYDLNSDGTSVFVDIRSNLITHGTSDACVNRVPCVYPSKYTYMAIDSLGTIADAAVNSQHLFGRFTSDEASDVSINKFTSTVKIFLVTPLARLDRLKIEWFDSTGTHVDFQGRDHAFVLELIEYIDGVDINNYSSRRGVSDTTSYSKGMYMPV